MPFRLLSRLTILFGLLLAAPLSAQPEATQFTFIAVVSDKATAEASLVLLTTDGATVELHETLVASALYGPVASPSVSPDGSRIAFRAPAVPYDSRFYVYTMATGQATALTTSETALYYAAPAWSPDGTMMAYSSWDEGGLNDVSILRADGSGATQVTATPHLDEGSVIWSPGGETLLYVQMDDSFENRQLVRVQAAGGEPAPLGAATAGAAAAVWSKADGRIYFATFDYDTSGASIYSIAPDGSDRQILYTIPGTDETTVSIESLSLSPDGRTLAFIRQDLDSEYSYSLHVLDIESGALQSPVWSAPLADVNVVEVVFGPPSVEP